VLCLPKAALLIATMDKQLQYCSMQAMHVQHKNLCSRCQREAAPHTLSCWHLQGVKDSEALRAAVEEVQPENVKLGLRLSQSRPLYEGFKWVAGGPGREGGCSCAGWRLCDAWPTS
jgi:hypothetical protein